MLDKHLGHPFHWELVIHLAGNQIARGAMFPQHAIPQGRHPFGLEPDWESCHVSTSYKVTSTSSSGKAFTSSSGKLKIYNVGQAFGSSISLGIWDIHLAGNQTVRYVMFLHHARFPLLIVQENLKTFNV